MDMMQDIMNQSMGLMVWVGWMMLINTASIGFVKHKEARIALARRQILESRDYDYLLMNDDLESCCRNAVRICQVERLRRDGRDQQRRLASG